MHQQISDEELAAVFSSKICNDFFCMIFILVICLSIQKLRFP